jgi:hypothetical protein
MLERIYAYKLTIRDLRGGAHSRDLLAAVAMPTGVSFPAPGTPKVPLKLLAKYGARAAASTTGKMCQVLMQGSIAR